MQTALQSCCKPAASLPVDATTHVSMPSRSNALSASKSWRKGSDKGKDQDHHQVCADACSSNSHRHCNFDPHSRSTQRDSDRLGHNYYLEHTTATETSTVTTTATATETESRPSATVYAACAPESNNFVGANNVYNNGGGQCAAGSIFTSTSASSASDCCNQCQASEICQGSAFAGSRCIFLTPQMATPIVQLHFKVTTRPVQLCQARTTSSAMAPVHTSQLAARWIATCELSYSTFPNVSHVVSTYS